MKTFLILIFLSLLPFSAGAEICLDLVNCPCGRTESCDCAKCEEEPEDAKPESIFSERDRNSSDMKCRLRSGCDYGGYIYPCANPFECHFKGDYMSEAQEIYEDSIKTDSKSQEYTDKIFVKVCFNMYPDACNYTVADVLERRGKMWLIKYDTKEPEWFNSEVTHWEKY